MCDFHFNFVQVGDLCYRKQTGSKVYDMLDNLAFREDLEVTTDIGINVTSTIILELAFIHQRSLQVVRW